MKRERRNRGRDSRTVAGYVLCARYLNPQIDEYAVTGKSMGVALANAAKHKLVGLLVVRLKSENVYVGEVMIAGSIKGTAISAIIVGQVMSILEPEAIHDLPDRSHDRPGASVVESLPLPLPRAAVEIHHA